MIVAVIDGMGGGIGAQIVSQLREALPSDIEIWALGTNAIATQKMMQAGANRGASGENAICISAAKAGVILAPIGVVVPNAMMGEITPAMAEAVATAPGRKLLIPLAQTHFEIVGVVPKPLAQHIAEAVQAVADGLQAAQP
ncbi:MAG: DUF3842 family protein [Anaerolineae bacterium]|nr:DUF3842 family protein [Anaerolineae bacterium]